MPQSRVQRHVGTRDSRVCEQHSPAQKLGAFLDPDRDPSGVERSEQTLFQALADCLRTETRKGQMISNSRGIGQAYTLLSFLLFFFWFFCV